MTETTQAWEKLLDVLSRQRKEYEAFITILKRKEKLLIAGKTKELEKLMKEENKRIDALETLEEERVAAVGEIAGRGATLPALTELLDRAPAPMRDSIENEAVGLMSALNGTAALNRSNAELIKTSSDYIQYNLNILTTSGVRHGVYEESGKVRSPEKKVSGFLNKQV